MVATLCLLGCILTPAQPKELPFPTPPASPGRPETVPGPRLGKSQELVYRGTFEEKAASPRVQFEHWYRLEVRAFVLDTPPRGYEVAVLTTLKDRDTRPGAAVSGDPASRSVRLERGQVDLQGKVTAEPGVSLTVPLEGAPAGEWGMFTEVPAGRLIPDVPWTVEEPGRPPHTWRFAGSEMINGTSCFKLVGEQKSEDWDRPRGDHTAWIRTDTVWVSARLGVACQLEREIKRREPARDKPYYVSKLRCNLESSLQYPGATFDQRRTEIQQARAFAESAAPLVQAPAKFTAALNALHTRITYHLEHETETPYREAVLQVKRLVEAAKRGEAAPPPLPAEDAATTAPAVATVGELAPDFFVPEFPAPGSAPATSSPSARLRQWQGKPVLLVFYSPTSSTATELLQYAQTIHASYAQQVIVLGLSVSEDAAAVQKQRADLGLTFPVLNGSSLRASYARETPRIVLLDAKGVVRGAYTGWGRETPNEVFEELRRWVQR
jgi:peroxiredoxin